MFEIKERVRNCFEDTAAVATYGRKVMMGTSILEVEAGSNVFSRADNINNACTYIRFSDRGSSEIEIIPVNDENGAGVYLALRGSSAHTTLLTALEFAIQALKDTFAGKDD